MRSGVSEATCPAGGSQGSLKQENCPVILLRSEEMNASKELMFSQGWAGV